MKFNLTIICFLLSLCLFGQTSIDPQIEPEFFSADEEITITYDVTATSLQSFQEAWIWMWVPGKGIDAPSNINPASSNSSATNPAKFTRSTGNSGEVYFSLTLTPTEFLNTSAENIESIGMLLKGNDWSDGQTTDYIAQINDGFSLVVDNPSGNYGFYNSSESLSIEARTSETATIEIFVDGGLIESTSNVTSLSTTHTIIDDGNVHEIKITATNGSETLVKNHTYTITPTPSSETLPLETRDGINCGEDNTSVTLALRAPNKEHVFVIGDFNDWSLSNEYLMKKDDEVFWLTLSELTPGEEYLFQYLVDGELKIADPYAEKISSQFDDAEIISDNRYPNLKPYPGSETSEAASFLRTNKSDYVWEPFTRPQKEDLVIYELLIRDFTEERTFEAVINRLDYLQDLGVNAIELMPVQEFEGNLSWGYNPAFMFAVDKYYGTELDFKTLVNEAHKRGIAIILDIVLNHQFGRNSLVRLYNEGLYGNPTSENPWFNTTPKHDFNVGYDMNHESQYTKDYVDRVVTYWLEEYNIDGYRFDLSKGFTQRNSLGNVSLWGQYDASRIAIWKRIADVIWAEDPSAYIILEHFAENREEKELSEYGMMLWGNMNHTYINAAKGSSASLSQTYYVDRGWSDPHLISYMESHDEERLMWEVQKSHGLNYSLERAKLATAFFLTVPGPKLIWQFGEFGYDEELNNDRLGIKPTHWEYLEEVNRKKLFDLYKSIINLKVKSGYINEQYFHWSPSGLVKTINIDHPEVSIYLIGNFDDEAQTSTHKFSKPGTWYDYFTGASFEVTNPSVEVTLGAGEWHIFTSELIENYIEDQEITLSSPQSLNEIIYPNPTDNEVRVSGTWNHSNYYITDQTGRVLFSGTLKDQTIDVSNLNSGIYFLTLENQARKLTETIVIR
ncbi:Por secretion system C-terminal sorting domain-containing protein [Ekhidna lutea]|uniref:Por secretion system C-terminal sorting domain-containing protein n=1 Tax=Ekhidna lutea TaxID=447679 RepID=A0A239LXC2_EKHLU|nr:alpha-amylase family glycosyl hydrolase [Ekhidna lutea]SNT34453.1 Por secretion system C-terminal sorting domain-containing protein [Ekhidna lutea]